MYESATCTNLQPVTLHLFLAFQFSIEDSIVRLCSQHQFDAMGYSVQARSCGCANVHLCICICDLATSDPEDKILVSSCLVEGGICNRFFDQH